jgi:hypothetical protein
VRIPTTPEADLKETVAPNDIMAARIAVVKPIFSDTAYNNAFYVFYGKYASSEETYIKADLNYLNVTVKDDWGWSYKLYTFISSDKAKRQGLFLGMNVVIIDEVNVTYGGLFENGQRRYDVIVLGFTEYVTRQEYYAYRDFVAQGGTLVEMDACNFLAEVKYYPPVNGAQAHLSLVRGHGWEFNGTCAWKSVYANWEEENRNWIGSNYWHWWMGEHYDWFVANTTDRISTYLRNSYGANISTCYGAHEENLLQNLTNTNVIGYWHFVNSSEQPKEPVASYVHKYMSGKVFHTGIMSSDILDEEFIQAFLVCAIRAGYMGEVGNWCFPESSGFRDDVRLYNSYNVRAEHQGVLSGGVYCLITLNKASITSEGVSCNLSSVEVIFFLKSLGIQALDSNHSYRIRAREKSIVSWQAGFNTTTAPYDTYGMMIRYKFVSSINNETYIQNYNLIGYYSFGHEVPNPTETSPAPPYAALIAAPIAVLAIILTYALDARHTGMRKLGERRLRGKGTKARWRCQIGFQNLLMKPQFKMLRHADHTPRLRLRDHPIRLIYFGNA